MNIFILTGAGISAESGLGTFRDMGGLWSAYDLNDVATPESFARDPALVHDFYNARRQNCRMASPNAAHAALAHLQRNHSSEVHLVTQNIDDLHGRAGSRPVWQMHGDITGALCAACGHRWAAPEEMKPSDPCPACGLAATRPDVVWFGEYPRFLDEIQNRLEKSELFVSIGTSGSVYPAAGFVSTANSLGIRTLEFNLEPSETATAFMEARNGRASELVPAWVDEILSQTR